MGTAIRMGSRGSPLAVAQTEWVAAELKKKNPNLDFSFKRIKTTGDKDAQSSLKKIGGKGVFVKEIEEALINNEIDVAVHSLKDVPQLLPDGLILGPYPKREDSRDVLVSRFGEQLRELPRGSTIGTSSPRRAAQILNRYKKRYRVAEIRGNIETRLKKVEDGDYDAVVMALAGLKRLSLQGQVTEILESSEMMPAPCQGCLGLEVRESDSSLLKLIQTISDATSDKTARAERAFLQGLGGSCLVPVAGQAIVKGNQIEMQAAVYDMKGEKSVRAAEKGSVDTPELVGANLAERILHEGGSELLA